MLDSKNGSCTVVLMETNTTTCEQIIIRERTKDIKVETTYCTNCGHNHYENIGTKICVKCGENK